MKGSKFVFESVGLLYYGLHKPRLRRGRSYIRSPRWLENEGATINRKYKNDDNCFQYALTASLNHENIKRNH